MGCARQQGFGYYPLSIFCSNSQRAPMRFFLIVAAAFAVAGCQIIYKLPTRQGNIIQQKSVDQLKLGMTREQVHFLMGTPIGASPFRPDRWDYVGYYRSPRGEVTTRTVSLFFEGQQLARMEGISAVDNSEAIADPDMKNVLEAEKKAKKQAGLEANDRSNTGAHPTANPQQNQQP